MNASDGDFTYHVLLIGIDQYPPGYNSLSGCVSDIDAIEDLLLGTPGIGIPRERIQITRLAAPREGYHSTSSFLEQTRWPDKTNVVTALKMLAAASGASDRVLIYYSGHGDEIRPRQGTVWREALVPHDNRQIEYLFDVEVNLLIGAIAEKTSDLTVILDCCHSAGATRDMEEVRPESALRFLRHGARQIDSPDLTALDIEDATVPGRPLANLSRNPHTVAAAGSVAELPPWYLRRDGLEAGMLRSPAPNYLVVAACQADERAGEGVYPSGTRRHGVLTYSLLNLLKNKDADQRARLRWADIWSDLLARTAERNVQLRQSVQHPRLIGRSERKIFGGPWEEMDPGYRVIKNANGTYQVNAGTLMGITVGAEIAVYGSEPRFFPALDADLPKDQSKGRLKVIEAARAYVTAAPVGAPFDLPDGVRGRLIKPGKSERLQVSWKPESASLPALIEESPLLTVILADRSDADVEVIARPSGDWIIGTAVEPIVARVPAGAVRALRAGLEHCYRSTAALRFARNCSDPQVSNCLDVRILDCNRADFAAMMPEELSDPDLPEAFKDDDGIYRLSSGYRFCFRVTNSSRHKLYITVLNVSAGGLVEYLSDTTLRAGASQPVWLDDNAGAVFVASVGELPDDLPGVDRPPTVTDRVLVVGATRPDVDLHYLTVSKRIQEVVDENLPRRGDERPMRPAAEARAPAELWTATITPIRIPRR
jgi:hypothetical protein